ncbi:hypothetical protein HY484_03975 [Candidatus Woesearchaeota archaeon]|nr:hypothetical protein [Candidatus Woesearchaeota archaeon]
MQVLSYYDERLEKPELFVSKVEGKMIGEKHGKPEKPYLKNKFLAQVFVLDGHEKTLAEMNEEEY